MNQLSTETLWVGLDVHQNSITAAILGDHRFADMMEDGTREAEDELLATAYPEMFRNKFIVLAEELGLETAASGVRYLDQLDFLRERKCKEAQGYLFTEPLQGEELLSWLPG